MTRFIEGQKYLCGIGDPRRKEPPTQFEVGTFYGGLFKFSNGAYSNTELYHRHSKNVPPHYSNATRVLTARKIK